MELSVVNLIFLQKYLEVQLGGGQRGGDGDQGSCYIQVAFKRHISNGNIFFLSTFFLTHVSVCILIFQRPFNRAQSVGA